MVTRARRTVYSPEDRTVEFRRVAFDVDRAAAKIQAAEAPDFLAARLHEDFSAASWEQGAESLRIELIIDVFTRWPAGCGADEP
jgi:hypothetical protein